MINLVFSPVSPLLIQHPTLEHVHLSQQPIDNLILPGWSYTHGFTTVIMLMMHSAVFVPFLWQKLLVDKVPVSLWWHLSGHEKKRKIDGTCQAGLPSYVYGKNDWVYHSLPEAFYSHQHANTSGSPEEDRRQPESDRITFEGNFTMWEAIKVLFCMDIGIIILTGRKDKRI